MNLRDSLRDYSRNRDDPTRFPGERRTTTGRFSGLDGRLVHVGRDGRLRDFSTPLVGRSGLVRARLGARVDGDVRWLDGFESIEQRYVGDTALVESTFDDGDVTVDRADLTVDDDHLTHVAVDGPADALVVFCSFAPDGREGRVGKLVHGDRGVVEAYHRREHDYLAASTGFEALEGKLPASAGELLDGGPATGPRSVDDDTHEATRLGGDLVATVPLEDGATTVLTRLAGPPTDRDAAVDAVRARAADVDAASLRELAREQAPDVPGDAAADVRALALLAAPSGARVAGPDFDPLYANSGGYGYTWFRDDAEIARHLLAADSTADLGLEDWHDRSAAFYRDTQLEDGTWPHRVWPDDGTLAPGWANANIEGAGDDYQADQTASVVAFLADYERTRLADGDADVDREAVRSALDAGVAALDRSLEADGLPEACQNAWEDMTGRFAHTAATYLAAYASVARLDADRSAPGRDRALADHAADQARAVLDGLDALWDDDRGAYALRLADGDRDDRLDASTFALVDAHATAAAAGVDVDGALDRLVEHTASTLDGLYRDTGDVVGLVRYEGDDWRAREQAEPKVWTVSTAWGAVAAAELDAVLADRGRAADAPVDFGAWADDLLAELEPGGSLCRPGAYLPEQFFDDGTPDSATPLGWPHAIRLATATKRRASDEPVPVPEDD